jgi:hypothetical protein
MQRRGRGLFGVVGLSGSSDSRIVTNPRPFFIGVAKNLTNEKDNTKENL